VYENPVQLDMSKHFNRLDKTKCIGDKIKFFDNCWHYGFVFQF